MLTTITTKTGLAPGVALNSLRPFVQEDLVLCHPARGAAHPAPAGGGTAEVQEELGQDARAELKNVIMQVLLLVLWTAMVIVGRREKEWLSIRPLKIRESGRCGAQV